MMSTGLPTSISLTKQRSEWGEQEEIMLMKMATSLSGFLLNIRQYPIIRYLSNSQSCEKLASKVAAILNLEVNSNKKEFDGSRTTLIITERKEDPATPVVFDWSYLSMIHECLGMDNNRVKAAENVS